MVVVPDQCNIVWKGRRCTGLRVEHLLVCERHAIKIGEWAIRQEEVRSKLADSLATSAIADQISAQVNAWGDHWSQQRERLARERAERRPPCPVVYYIRLSEDRIKIGKSDFLARRLKAFRVREEDVLAAEPGSYQEETRRHHQFAHLRTGDYREDFSPGDDLMEHIAQLRAKHGKPFELITRILTEQGRIGKIPDQMAE
ncbi:hypothetical protein AB0L65_33015 [Nonomuraea sp. NPDC052116]|uniref:hypothetical protein n=1 Tax=Nonomuraea sp. NPDC052116 TaxID=3155665 RepID=UPI003436D517